jgi:HNH endonuclease
MAKTTEHARFDAAVGGAAGRSASPYGSPTPPADPVRGAELRKRIKELLDEGLAQFEVAAELGVTPGTVSRHARQLGYRRGLHPDRCAIARCRLPPSVDGLCETHLEQRATDGWCGVAGCKKPVTRPAPGLCEMHYYRQYRHGTVGAVRKARVLRRVDRGYVVLRVPEHPLANDGWVYEHRLVLYEQQGPGPQECWWCGAELHWDDRDLNVDHLDYDRSNNDPDNLVISCRACNMGRGAGCDPEGWAISMATRRVLRRHAEEFSKEVARMRARLDGVPDSAPATSKRVREQQAMRAARAVHRETARP